MHDTEQVKVWDLAVRIFHWMLVIAFFTAYATGEDAHEVHEFMGYLILVLVVLRIVWGFVGPEHARFANFVRGPAEVFSNIAGIVKLHPKRYLGHSPAGGAMVVALLSLLLATTVTGIVGEEQHEGDTHASMVQTAAANSENDDDDHDNGELEEEESLLIEVHEVLANLTLALVLLHIAGVILASFTHRENLIGAMFSGRKHR